MTVQIRSATYTSSYTSGTLTVARPSGMVAGDFLVVFLVAMGVYWGNAYWGSGWHHEYGNPPPPTPPPPGPTSGGPVAPGDYPHHPPMSTLVQAAGGFDHNWFSGGTHYYGNYWSNLGLRQSGSGATDWDNPSSQAALALWPFVDGWWAPKPPDDANDWADPCMFTITAVGRTVDGSEASTFTFTLNNPLDSEYDYRGFAFCFTANDWAGNFYDTIDAGGTDAKSLSTAEIGYFPATGVRDFRRVSTFRISGSTDYFKSLQGYGPWADIWGTWPIPEAEHMFLADSTTPQLDEPAHPVDLVNPEELIVNIVTYAGPTSWGDPTSITLADLSTTPNVDPLPVLHQEVWTKGSSTLMIHLTTARPTAGHATNAEGDGIIVITPRLLSGAGGPIVAPYPPALVESPSTFTEYCAGIALSFRVRVPYVAPLLPAIPARLATIVG